MGIFTVTGNDTLTLNGHVFVDQAYGAVSHISLPNELINMKTGKNANTVIALNQSGFNANLTMRLARGSADDQFMQGLVPSPSGNFAATTLLGGTFVKYIGDGQGNVLHDIYTLGGGVVSRQVESMENTDGETEQGVVVYNVKFANAGRIIS